MTAYGGLPTGWRSRCIAGVLWIHWGLIAAGCRPSHEPVPSEPTTSEPAISLSTSPPAEAVVEQVPPLFVDVTEQTELSFLFSSGRSAGEYAILESLGGGVSAFDYDLDGRVDLVFAGGGSLDNQVVTGRPGALYRNLGDWKFCVVTDLAGTAAAAFYNHGFFPGDFNSDGFADLAISGYGGVQLLQNQGDGTFRPVDVWTTHPDNAWSTSLAWADVDSDGNLDLYVTHYVDWSWDNHTLCPGPRGVPREVCAPREFSGLSDALYLNDGAGGFRRVTQQVGLVEGGKGLGVVAGDVNLDGHVDFYVANDTTDNFLYLNNGQGHFREAALVAGVSGDEVGVNTGSMGVALEDADNDGIPDLWVTNFERELFALYRNEGSSLFSHITRRAGLATTEGLYVGFGTVMLDVDTDGDRDIVVANGHVSYHSVEVPFRQEPLLLINQAGQFERLHPDGYFGSGHTGRGLAYADLDNDGGWDLIFSHLEEPVTILRGREPDPARWARVQLVGRESNRAAIGAALHVPTASGTHLYMLNSGGSYLSHNDSRIRITVPENPQATQVRVRWPGGREEVFPMPQPGSDVVWVEGSSSKSLRSVPQ